MESMKWTTISVKPETKDQLAELGTKNTSFEDILQILLQSWRNNN